MFERFTREARAAVVLAQEEAREFCDSTCRPEHLLLGVLQGAGPELTALLTGYGLTADGVRERLQAAGRDTESFDDDAEALAAIGIDLHAVRDQVNRSFGDDVFDDALRTSGRRRRRRGHIPFDRAGKSVMELALREALAHKSRSVDAEYLLLAIIRGGDRHAAALIGEHVDPAQLSAAVLALVDRAA